MRRESNLITLLAVFLALAVAVVPAHGDVIQSEKLADELFRQAVVANKRKQTERTILLLKRVIELSPTSRNAYLNLATIYLFDKNDPQQAEQLIKKAIQLDPTDFGYHWTYALALREQKKYSAARKVLADAAPLKKTPRQQQNFRRELSELDRLVGGKSIKLAPHKR